MSKIIKKDKLDNYNVRPAFGHPPVDQNAQLQQTFGPNAYYVQGNGPSYGNNSGSRSTSQESSIFSPPTAAKNDQDKPDLSLIPQVLLVEIAKAFMVGETKYGRYNYTKGHTASQLVAAAMRHLTAWNDGEDYDPKDGQHHLGSVGACVGMILRQAELGTLTDNRFKKGVK